jgi:hypothetical protein
LLKKAGGLVKSRTQYDEAGAVLRIANGINEVIDNNTWGE